MGFEDHHDPGKRHRQGRSQFGTIRPAMAIFERGPTTHTNAIYNGLNIHALNPLVGSMYAVGGLTNQMGVPYVALPWKVDDYIDDVAKAANKKKLPRIDRVKTRRGAAGSQSKKLRRHIAHLDCMHVAADLLDHAADLMASICKRRVES